MLKGALDIKDMGQDFGGTLSGREVEYLMKHEWAECFVWRKSRIGIQLDEKQYRRMKIGCSKILYLISVQKS